jgi:hypothetical protein
MNSLCRHVVSFRGACVTPCSPSCYVVPPLLSPDSFQTERYLGVQQDLTDAPCDYLHLKVE